ncbi:1,3-beta-glucanase, partial [Roseomonas nepalensis]
TYSLAVPHAGNTPPNPPPPPPPLIPSPIDQTIGSGPDTMVLKISEDAWNGHAQYTVKVDGVAVGNGLTAAASHALGQSDTLTLKGSWGAGAHTVEVSFLNDAWGGSASTDRNLYVDGVTYNGKAVPAGTASLLQPVTASFQVPAKATSLDTTIGSGPDALVLKVSEDAWNGHAQYTVKVDGAPIGGTLTAAASHALGQSDTLTLKGAWGTGAHTVEVSFLNDAWGGSASTDRNL